jgi:uncharacterized membrane protein YraQ (UPF0718 family)
MDTLFTAAFLPLEWLASWVAFDLLRLGHGTLGEAVAFFLYDTPRILLMLTAIVFAVAVLRSFFAPERTKEVLSRMPAFTGHVAAAGLGVLTPF